MKLGAQNIDNSSLPELDQSNSVDLSSLKVMIIDDSKTIRKSAETLLSKEGCEVLTAEDGFEALAIIAVNKPDIIFVDIMMPRLDGYQTCTLIKNNRQFRDTPVVMLTSKDSIFDKARGRIVGSEEYLTKPFTRDDLLQAVNRHANSQEVSA
jgi:twitching motility two-component system response regulator PilG